MTDGPPRALFGLSGTGGRGTLLGWTVALQGLSIAILFWGPLDEAGLLSRLAVYGAFGLCVAAWVSAVVRRLHDMGRSGWFAAFFLIPIVGLLLLIWALLAERRPLDPDRFRPALRYDVALAVLLTVAVVFATRAVWAPHRMAGEAMRPTLEPGALFLSHRIGPTRPMAGDVVLVRVTKPDGAVRRAVGRVVASGGQRVALRDGVPLLDGVEAMRRACDDGACFVETLPGGASYRVVAGPGDMAPRDVPEDAVFLMADNRLGPSGSLGVVPLSSVQGYVLAPGSLLE